MLRFLELCGLIAFVPCLTAETCDGSSQCEERDDHIGLLQSPSRKVRACGDCCGCLWSNSVCYDDVQTADECTAWPGNLWCPCNAGPTPSPPRPTAPPTSSPAVPTTSPGPSPTPQPSLEVTTTAPPSIEPSPAPGSSAIPGLGPGGNPTPALSPRESVHFDEETLQCADAKWKPDSTGLWTFEQIAGAFLEYGAKKFYAPNEGPDLLTQCVGALVTAAGECQETAATLGKGCSATLTKDSGVFQLDFLRTGNTGGVVNPQIEKDGGIMNLCISGFGAGYMTGAPWFDEASSKVAELEGDSFTTCMGAPPLVNDYACPDPNAEPGVQYSNYVGTFCHKGYASRWSTCSLQDTSARCCGVWNGGANDYQGPFPDYYYKKALEHLDAGADFEATCKSVIGH